MIRYDYEECESEGAEAMMDHLRKLFASSDFIGKDLKATTSDASFKVGEADDFSYTDPIDGSVSKKQGLYIKFQDGSRIIFRLSGTGSSGATVRLYVEKYSKDESEYGKDAQDGLKPLIEVALAVSKLKEFTGREKPTVITVSSHACCAILGTLLTEIVNSGWKERMGIISWKGDKTSRDMHANVFFYLIRSRQAWKFEQSMLDALDQGGCDV